MIGLKFEIHGKYAFFKNPESNNGTVFSFEHIHKPAILGMLGCVLGLDGRGQMKEHNNKLEYYEKLKDIKLSIIPSKPIFRTHNEVTNNSTGFGNAGETQGIPREVLNDVRWTIILDKSSFKDTELYNTINDKLKRGRSVYPISLGNSRYNANFSNVEGIELNDIEVEDVYKIDSLYTNEIIVQEDANSYDEALRPYLLKMYFPIGLNELTLYEYDWVSFSNLLLEVNSIDDIKEISGNYYYFM